MSDSDKEFAFRNSNSSANKWAEEASSVLSNAESHYSTYRKDTGKKSLDYQAKINRLISGGQYWKEQYKGNSDAVHKINSIMQALESGDSYVRDMSRYYFQFDNENSYKESQELNKLYNMSSSELEGHLKDKNPIAYTTLSGQNITWKNLYDSRTKEENFNVLYNNLSSMSDWEKMSQYRSTQGSGMIPFLPADAEHEWINDPVTKVSERTSDLSVYKYVANQMTDEERAVFNYLYNKSGKDRAYAFMDSIQSELKKRQENANIQSAIRLAKEVPVLPSVASFVTNLLSPIEYAYDALDYYVFGELTGRDTMDTNHAAALTSAIRGTVSENTDWMIGDWDAHDFLYSTAMSGVDSLLASGIYGIGGGISLGLSAAAQATNDALSKGQTNKQAFLSGLVSGVFESLWESVSIGKFKALKDVTPKSIKDVVKNIGKQMLVNASEEFNTEVANIVYDSLANGAFSDYESSVRAYMQSGMSESEARTKAASDLAFQTIEAAASGALMGAGFGGIGSIQGYINGGKVASDIYGSDPAALINESLEIDPNNTLALKLKEKLDKGKNISGMELNQLVQKNERTMNRQDTAAIQKAVSDRLTELGETGDIEALSIALTKRFSGKKLSNSENALIQNSQYGTRVSYEMNPTNIQSGDYASEWAENIGTNRINPEEYSRIVKASQITQDTQGAEDSSVTADTDFDAPARAQDTETASAENQDSVQPEIDEHAAPDVQEEAVPAAQTLEEASEKYGEQADAMLQTYSEGQDVDEYDAAYRIAYDMGESGIPFDYVNRYAGTSYLTADQRKAAYEAGVSSAATSAGARDYEIKQGANGKTGWKQGVVSGEGVTGDDLQKAFNMNSTQVRAYNILTDIAKATGLNIVLYKSSADKNGKLVGAQGKYNHSEPGTLYIDLNAGLSKIQGADDLGKYTMLRTFSHEFTHFIENWNPSQYNVLRKAVFEAIDERSAEDGLSAHELVMKKMDNGLSYEAASREVTAEALTDILPDANFVETLAQKHKSVFEMLRDKLKEFATKIREYFENIGDNPSREARALKQSGHYVDSIVKLFDNVAVQAVENYQSNYAVDETSSAENSAESKAAEKTPSEPKAKVQAEPYVSENGYTITDNAEYGSIEVKFDSKPEQAVLDALKSNKFRWHKQKKVWYGKSSRETVISALDEAYAASGEAESIQEAAAEPTFTEIFENATQKEKDEVVDAIDENMGKLSHVFPTEIREEVPADTEAKHVETTLDNAGRTPSEKLASKLLEQYLTEENINRGGKALTAKELYALADEAFGGTQAEGAYNRKDAYDAMELAVNKFLLQYAQKANRTFNGNAQSAISAVKFMQDMLDLLPTQNVRTQEQQDFQQFSTPPNIAYLAAWAANINSSDMVLEPSAGIGGLAVFAKAWGAEVAVNELSTRRLGVLRSMGFDHLFNENAEQIDNILPENISPSVVIMNPPFSSTAGRTANNKTSNAEKHIDQALARLRDGGRLVAVLGKSMNNQDYYRYWDKLRKNFNIRANLSIDGSNYKKYGTTWGVQIVVIDKTGPQTGETVTGRFTDLTEVPKVLEGIRNDRRYLEENRIAGSDNGIRESVADGGNARNTDTGNFGSNQRTDGSAAGSQRTENREVSERNPGTGNRTDRKTDAKTGSQTAERKGGGTDRIAGRADTGDGNGAVKPGDADRHQPELPLSRLSEQEEVSDDGVYATFIAPDIPVKGGKKHPAVLVESAAMAAVSMPKATYTPKLPADVVKNNLSDAQLVTVTYAGQAHEQTLPDGRRKGFFIGDGTGVGKGRQIAGIILDNFMQGRTKAVWISKNNDLYGDAIRDWTATTGRGKDEVISQSKLKPKDKISMQSGILYSTYDTIKSEKGGSRLDQIVEWLGEDFDGVIAFDEAHNMGNLFGKKGKFGKSKGSEKAKAGVELQRRLPNARIVYVSATAATEVDNLAYAERLGLWGQETAFSDAKDFISKIGSSGLAAMELVIRDMKAMGSYVARSISYNGVNYDTVEHTLDPMQTEIYNTMSRAWQKTMQNVQSALETTGGRYNSNQRQKALGNFYSSMQRFYNQVLTSMSMPSVIADMRKELAAGHSCVLQIVNTNEAQQNKALAEAKASGESLDNLDLTPREALVGYLTNSFPTQMYEEYTDEDGNLRSRPVLDSAGNPVQSKEAIRQRDALIAEVNQMSIPDGPLEMLFDAFGPEAVAENTGRSRRVVPRKQADGSISRVEERRTLNHRTADVQAFQDGKKRILVFSDAGGTGKSYHADRSEKNQQQRIHYVLQPGWVASNAVQGFGRTHRSNETSAPIYKLVTTNIKGQKRFTSTIARRLDQLGALTKGQRDTGSGMFGAKDNLETDLAKDSLREFYLRLGKNQIEGIDGIKILERLGLKQKFTDEYGSFKINDNLARDIGTFLNRILALEVDEQNVVFDAFISIYEMELEAAIQAGTLDTGMENVKADRIEVVDDKVIREDKTTGAATHYIQAKTYTKPKIVTTVAEMEQKRSGFEGIYKTESGAVKAVYRIADKTTEWGAVQKQYRLVGPNQGAKTSVWGETGLKNKAEPVPKTDWQKEWDAEVAKVPEYNEDTLHMLTGALLPIWNNLPQDGNTKVKRLIAHDGSTYLGRVIGSDMIDGVLKGFSIGRTMETFTAQQVVDKAIQNGIRFQLTNDKAQIFRSRVSGEWRLEISQPYNSWYLTKRYPDIIQERIQYRDRYFIPVGEKGISILEKLLSDNPVRSTVDDSVQEQSRDYLDDDTEQYQQRTDTLTDREVLALASSQLANEDLTSEERSVLGIFDTRIHELYELQEKRREQGRIYKEQQFGTNVDREEAEKTRNRMKVLDGQIERASSRVLEVENKAVLKRILQRARKIVEQNQREHDQAIIKRRIDRMNNAAAIRKYRTRIQTDTNELTKWVLHPNNKSIVKHIPDAIKDTVIPFLESIDFTSNQQLNGGKATKADKEFEKQLKALKNVLNENINVEGLYSGYNDLPPNFMDNLQTFMDAVHSVVEKNTGTFVINEMSSEELHELSKIVRTLKKYIMDMNTFHNNAMFQHTYEAGDNSIEYMNGLKSAGNTGAVSNFLFWQQMRPAYAFERFGKGGIAIYDELRRGQDALAFNTKKIIDFSQNTYTEKEVKAWEKETHTFELGDDLVKIPVSGIMSLYELSKRPQGLQHILGGGIRVATYKDGKNKISDTGHTVTLEEVNRITETLTPRQKEVADALQKFMAEQGGEWGNYVSVKRFGESLFGEKNYFPINSDGRHLQAEADEKPGAASLYALLNMGFTKELNEKANNRVVLYSIFDVFANHMASMAQYNALALPVLDALKWFNYKQSDAITGQPSTSVRDEMNRVFGTPEETRPGAGKKGYAENFVINILKAYNGTEAQGAPMDSIGLKMLHKYNRAQVAFSFRVVVQQPLAITRAGMLIDYRSILRGMKLSPSAIRKNISEMQQYSGIAAWKSLGFYDVNISRGLTSLIKHDESKMDKFIEIGMAGAEKADTLTWAAMWSACKEEVMRKQKLKPGDNGFFEAVTELFENVIYKTQVVDSVLTKNEFIRDKGLFARTVGSFMSEPTTTASMLLDTVDKMNMDRKSGLSFQQTWKKNGKAFVRTVYVYAIGAVLLASVQAAADALRDDDDYEDFLEKWLEAFKGDLIDEANPFNKLPILSDLSDLVKEILAQWTDLDVYGNAPNSVIMQWYDSLVKGSEIMHDLIVGNDTNYTWYAGGYKLLQALSGMTGVPLAAITREIASIWNTFVGAMAPSLKLKIYDGGEMNELKYAYKDGYLTDEEATALLLEKGLVDTEDEAYWKIQEWADSGDGFSKYDDVYDAVRNGGDFDAAMDELTSHGVSEKDALSEVKGKIGEWYKGGEVSKQQATEMLKKYTKLTDKEIASAMNKWSCVVVTGIPFDDIKDEYLAGNISASRAAEMYSRYGGYELGAARETVSKWNFESKYGYTYSEIGQRFRDGELSAREMLNVMTTYGGKTMEEAQSSLLNYVRDGYDDGIFSENAAINMMVQYCGVDQDKALNKVRYINIRNQFPNIEIDDHWVSEYYDEIEPYGISPEIFFNYRDTVKEITGEGKKQNRMAVIDSLPISSSQKDALYYAEGWAASRIYEAPWH